MFSMTTSQAPINEPFKSGRKSCGSTSGSCARQNHTVLPSISKNVRIGSQYVHLQYRHRERDDYTHGTSNSNFFFRTQKFLNAMLQRFDLFMHHIDIRIFLIFECH